MQKKEIAGTAFRGVYLDVSLQTLVDILGDENIPRDVEKTDSKITHEWTINVGPNDIITVYDYKNPPVDDDSSHRWHVGGTELSKQFICEFLQKYGFKLEDIVMTNY